MNTPAPDPGRTGPATLGGAEAPAAAPAVTPFWQRMPLLFAFPLQRPALLRNAASTLLFTVVFFIVLPQLRETPLRSTLLLLAFWIGTSLYVANFAFLVIERMSAGYLDSRHYPPGEPAPNPWRPVKMFFVMVCVPVVIAIIGALGLPGVLVVLALMLFALLLPASVMVLTMTDSFSDAVNPGRCSSTALQIGPPYLLLCLFLFMLSISSRQAIGFLLGGSSASMAATAGAAPDLMSLRGTMTLSIFAFTLVQNYFLVLTCALIGYAMYQYSGVLGIDVVGPGETRRAGGASAAAHARRVREAMIGKMIAAGEFREALGLISDDLRERPNDLSLHVRMHTLLLHEGSRPRIEDHAERYLELLMASGNLKEALALFEKTREMFPDFLPRDPARLPQLAGAAVDALNPKLAAHLVRGFDKKHPGHPSIPEVYVVGARILLLSGGEREAKRLLQYVTTTYPGTPAAAEARRYLARFDPKAAPPTLPGAPILRPRPAGAASEAPAGPAAGNAGPPTLPLPPPTLPLAPPTLPLPPATLPPPPRTLPLPPATLPAARMPLPAPAGPVPGSFGDPGPATLPLPPRTAPPPATLPLGAAMFAGEPEPASARGAAGDAGPATLPLPRSPDTLPLAPAMFATPSAEPEYMVEDVDEPGPYPDILLEPEPAPQDDPAHALPTFRLPSALKAMEGGDRPAPADAAAGAQAGAGPDALAAGKSPEPAQPPSDTAAPSFVDLVTEPLRPAWRSATPGPRPEGDGANSPDDIAKPR